ncbi:unnamed protein product [Adineta steineri]|uniref:Cadherin domain-containing protein n=1 Tax=Adineta steineri TaxID=433720 RepID=A0A813VLL2_9BILA|nr:unnamed protein product [Adineta steineri]CAF3560042.1 unnamed protein product [Adineta steineri]
MSCSWLWLIVYLFFIFITSIQSRYIRLPSVNCSELSPIGTPITQLLNILPSSNWGFTFLTRTSVISYFLLDDIKGTITVKRPLDREDLCRLGICSCFNECILKLEINALSDIYTHIIYVPILILDENDNFCYFSNDIYYLNISESVRLNTRIILPIAHDPDQTPNNVQSYSIVSNNYTEFRLDYQIRPSLIIIEPLDRELHDKYLFNFCAYEGIDNQKRSCCTKILLTITDINDNSPIFQHNQQSPLIIKISELSPIHTELIQMKAFDPDDGLNGQIKYTFSKWTQNDVTINKIFNLNSQNGSITLLKQLDYEERNNYELQIQAKDLGLNAIPTYATVIVEVIDENDWPPELFTFTPADVQLINNSIIYILENISVGTPILYLTVSDRDSGENGRVSIELIPSMNQTSVVQLEKVSDNTYALKTIIQLDREQNSYYSFTLFVYDHGEPKQSIKNLFELHLIDVNDCSPIFDNSTNYSFYINENNKENFPIHTIKVDDFDEHDHVTLQLKFDSEQNYNDLFELNEQNQLIILKSLDYEQQSLYQFSIQAEDTFGHQTSISILIHVNDLNDNPVEFLTNFTQFQIEENQNNQTYLGHIQAEDKDKNMTIIYTIDSNDNKQINNFIELKSNGNLYTKISFDREQLNRLQFYIIANDSYYTDKILIEILILDQNDNKPMLKSKSPYCYIYNTTNSNQTIEIQLDGYDPDENENGNIIYSLKNPSSKGIRILSNGLLIIEPIFQEYKFDIYLTDQGKFKSLSSSYENFIVYIVYDEFECQNYSLVSSLELDQRTFIYFLSIILISLACFIIITLFICCCIYYRQRQIRLKSSNNKPITNLTPSFSSSLNDDAENDTLLISSPSPQFTAMTTISTSTTTTNDSNRLTTFTDRLSNNKSSSLSSSSSSTYVKMSRSFEDEIL